MTKNNMHKIVKKRAGLNKLKKLENKKKFLKKHQLWLNKHYYYFILYFWLLYK